MSHTVISSFKPELSSSALAQRNKPCSRALISFSKSTAITLLRSLLGIAAFIRDTFWSGKGNYKQVLALKKESVDFKKHLITLDASKNLPLDNACLKGHYDIVKLLINSQEELGVTHNISSYCLLLETVKQYLFVLLDNYNKLGSFCSFNSQVNFLNNYSNIIQLLIKKYPEQLNRADNKGINALFYVVDFWADIFKKNIKGNAKNFIYSFKHEMALLELLIESGSHVDSKDPTVKSVMSLAKRRGIANFLTNLITEIEHRKQKPSKSARFFDENKLDFVFDHPSMPKEITQKKQCDKWPYAYYESLIFKIPIEHCVEEQTFVNSYFDSNL